MIGRLRGNGDRDHGEHGGSSCGMLESALLTSIVAPSSPYQVEEGQVGHNGDEHEGYCEGHAHHAEDQASAMVGCP
jgi:hypothetical protein